MHRFLVFLLLIGASCKTSKHTTKNPKIDPSSLSEAIMQLAKCHNTLNEKCLTALYHEDFETLFPPSAKDETKSELVQSILKNYADRALSLDLEVTECYNNGPIGYAIVDWKLQTNQVKSSVIYHQNTMQIWEWKDGQWQLKKLLFYDK